MKWCRFYATDGSLHFGTVEGEHIVQVRGSPFEQYEETGQRHALSSVRLAVPAMPYNFYAMGANFRKHLDWANRRFNLKIGVPKAADMGYRSPSALIASGETIVIPSDSIGPVQYEGELVAVIGRKTKNLSKDEALSCVLGYTLGNDLSERAWQFSDRTMWRGKNADTFKPMGPVIETELDPSCQDIQVRVNAKLVCEYNTRDAVHDLATCISRTSRYVTFYPGDVIWLGCDGACEPDLVAGDVVEISNASIGVLRNRVVREPAECGEH
jgi:2-keto-4-pentenoate hydratase/2-oxohepta-3-ene-1,7-dioic acid hydratase in catechol pathway